MKVRELAKKDRERVYWAHSSSHTSHITKCTHVLLNEYCRRSSRCSPLLAATLRCSPLSAAEHIFYNRPLKLGLALLPSHPVCLVIGSCCSEVIFTLSGAQRRSAESSGEQRRAAGRATTIA